jgi:hypothetical protein
MVKLIVAVLTAVAAAQDVLNKEQAPTPEQLANIPKEHKWVEKKHIVNGFIAKHAGEEKEKFSKWLATHNKSYTTMDEFHSRQGNWIKHNKMIHEKNEEADADGSHDAVRFAHNSWSDKSEHEILARMNYHQHDHDDEQEKKHFKDFHDEAHFDHGRHLATVA